MFVAFESPDLLEERRERKLRKYSRCKTAVHQRHLVSMSRIFVAAVGLGARGGVAEETQETFRDLGVWSKSFVRDLGARLVWGSCAIYRAHMTQAESDALGEGQVGRISAGDFRSCCQEWLVYSVCCSCVSSVCSSPVVLCYNRPMGQVSLSLSTIVYQGALHSLACRFARDRR